MDINTAILKLKQEKNAVILAHYYQEAPIQEVADFIGDSLELARKAAQTDADIIVFAGVYFMAETAKILNPDKKVLLPDLEAGCSLADGCPPDEFRLFLKKYSGHVVVSYINCSAEIKALSDFVCTSSNAVDIINSIPQGVPIIFGPDKNLGKYLIKVTQREMVLWDGACIVHEAFSLEKMQNLKKTYPEAKIIAHPESQQHILEIADFIGSTSKLIKYVETSKDSTYIVATEAGILHEMCKKVPHKLLIPAPAHENNACACSECPYMKMNTLDKLYRCLLNETPEVNLNEGIQKAALVPIKRMLSNASR